MSSLWRTPNAHLPRPTFADENYIRFLPASIGVLRTSAHFWKAAGSRAR
jgi:hypothetical protein